MEDLVYGHVMEFVPGLSYASCFENIPDPIAYHDWFDKVCSVELS